MTPPKPASPFQFNPQYHSNTPSYDVSRLLGQAGEEKPPSTEISIGLEIPIDGGKPSLLLGHRKIPLDKLRENLASKFQPAQSEQQPLLPSLKHFLGEAVDEISELFDFAF